MILQITKNPSVRLSSKGDIVSQHVSSNYDPPSDVEDDADVHSCVLVDEEIADDSDHDDANVTAYPHYSLMVTPDVQVTQLIF